ncbi:MAG: PD-(D/E)XK nuclease family protein [Bacteroidota bacterium]|nr:PD-(D/E)XK nuclease family protein [Bacteroidota bacterium]
MKSFLKEVAAFSYNTYQDKLHRVCMVFPNRRAGIFYSKYLGQLTGKPLLSPRIVTINNLVSEFSSLKPADPLNLIFRLYRVFAEVAKSTEPFDTFYYWGEMLMNDFDDVDKYLVNPEDIFRNLASLKEIEQMFDYLTEEQKEHIRDFWGNIASIDQSVNRDGFVSIWEVLLTIYQKFREGLRNDGEAYEGMIYREMVDKINRNISLSDESEYYIFAGFNALNPCERRLFSYLRDTGKADFLWDFDQYYLDINGHEAGLFMRDNLKQFPMPGSFQLSSNFANKKIEVIAVPSSTGQAQVVAEQLSKNEPAVENTTEDQSELFDRTAIVLGEEDLLIPVLSALPSNVGNVNITMGYPLRVTPVYGFVMELVDLQRNARVDAEGKAEFYHQNILSVLQHRLIRETYRAESDEIVAGIIRHNRVYLVPEELHRNKLFSLLFVYHAEPVNLSDYLLAILKELFINLSEQPTESDVIRKEYVYQIYLSVNRLADELNRELKHDGGEKGLSRETWFRLLARYLGGVTIPFEGEPVYGMQIMGILETRCLDFQTLYILSVNEGVMPRSGASHSFIPYQLRRGFGLPTMEQQDAMYAYYFYRLLQRAERVVLLYNPVPEGVTSGEMSRYIYQLKYDSKLDISEKSISFNIAGQQDKPVVIRKDQAMIDKLKERYASSQLSPSALNTYMDCSLKFYFHYVAGIKEKEDVLQEIDAAVFGKIFHNVLENLYKPFIGKTIQKADLEGVAKNDKMLDKFLSEAFDKEFFNLDTDQQQSQKGDIVGRNRLIFSIIKKSIKQILLKDASLSPFELVNLEGRYNMFYPVLADGKEFRIKLGGYIDRIDRVDGTLRIIDYKTGKDKLEFTDIASLFDAENNDRRKAVFQIMLYGLIYGTNFEKEKSIGAGIYQLRDVFGDSFDPIIKSKQLGKINMADKAQIEEFKNHLSTLLSEIFSVETVFDQVDVKKQKCSYCSYASICHRDGGN